MGPTNNLRGAPENQKPLIMENITSLLVVFSLDG